MGHREPVCFTCGEHVSTDPFANRLPDGEPCPACRDRLLDDAPSLLPRSDADESSIEALDAELELPASDPGYDGMRRVGLRVDPDDPDGPIGA